MAGSFGDWFGTLKNTFKVGKSTLSASGVATARTHTLPDAAGTVALTTDTFGGMVLRSYIAGFTIANNTTDATNDIDIAAGSCTDSSNTYLMTCSSTLTKQLDAAWAAGTNAGGLDTGTKATSTWYHIWVIRKDSDGTVDALYSTSNSSPTMPSGYTAKRWIGSIYNNSSNAIEPFLCKEIDGGAIHVDWSNRIESIGLSNTLTTTARLDAIQVPPGIKAYANLAVIFYDGTTTCVGIITDPDTTDFAPSTASNFNQTLFAASAAAGSCHWIRVYTNTSQQIRSRSNTATVDGYFVVTTGYDWSRR
jgi:hypothetical protein